MIDPAGRAQRADRGPRVLPRHRRVGRRRPGPVGAVGGALPGQRQRRLPQERPVPTQVPHGPAHPGTAAGAARPGRLGATPNAPAPPSCSPPPSTPHPASCSPPPGRRCAAPVMKTATTGRIWAAPPGRDPAGAWHFNLTTDTIGGSTELLDLYGVPPEDRQTERATAEASDRSIVSVGLARDVGLDEPNNRKGWGLPLATSRDLNLAVDNRSRCRRQDAAALSALGITGAACT